MLVAGGGFRHGTSLKYEPGKIPLCNLYVTMLQNWESKPIRSAMRPAH
ncbi:MAG: hypothetical protein CM1200mP2_17160 [Planctomycetaceae bacterium]|nr:MAG: hypothetical protein CM1200mP2_17160 [Planctomycetaceae bacterium]